MPYVALSDSLTAPPRPAWILRVNMADFVMKNDHRIPWNCLLRVFNDVIAGKCDIKVINSLLKLSPADNVDLIRRLKVVLSQHKPGKPRAPEHIACLEEIEQELFSLPVNISNGLNNRADDPGGDNMDFTPDDIDYAGNPMPGAPGELQKLRETLFGLLLAGKRDPATIEQVCQKIVTAIGHVNLNAAAPSNLAHWHPGPAAVPIVARTFPGYRYWVKPTGALLSSAEILTMIEHVTARAKKLGAG